jgi:hypothetical protein
MTVLSADAQIALSTFAEICGHSGPLPKTLAPMPVQEVLQVPRLACCALRVPQDPAAPASLQVLRRDGGTCAARRRPHRGDQEGLGPKARTGEPPTALRRLQPGKSERRLNGLAHLW